ncbi:probable phospholipid hydroperoxide glutathione peroxidase isoform X2 [Contarinia nasturtii]|uniref:probable phospholipid hydroperoxide glutathione peroxidase isoform X2 n=1 Tax=Contarinia nasturtii TaxID=265458 RepID=UPI0012D42335|nr:probable phospholipid hydroperoxide glutathione peroxidase isoform X2 [Contarinia nasturtii]
MLKYVVPTVIVLIVGVLISKYYYQSESSEEMASGNDVDYKSASSIYDFTVKDTYGKDVSLDKYRGNVVLIVNIASQCGLTKNNYAKLNELKKQYYERGLRILGFPCNQFAGQSPENDGDEMVCQLEKDKGEFGDVFAKINVNGNSAAPLYKYLKDKQGGFLGSAIKWNFTKFLVDKTGQPVNRFAPTTDPMDIAKEIEKLL